MGLALRVDALRPDLSASPADRYSILGRIAAGAMGEVFISRMRVGRGPDVVVALKRIRPELQVDHEVVVMFHDEARIAAQMDHPNIIRIHDIGELDGSMFIAMELVHGTNLSGVLRHLVEHRRPLPIPVALRIALDTLDALDYAHRFTDEDGRPLNVVHRDVSPQNLLVSFDGEVKLFDFGVTRAEGRLHKTHPGLLKGKLGYMAPEQIAGQEYDARADIFALGTLLYESLLFQHPFHGKTDAMVLKAIMESQPIDPRRIDPRFPEDLTKVLMRALEKEPQARYVSAAAMSHDLEALIARRGIDASRRALREMMLFEFDDRVEALSEAHRTGNDQLLVDAVRGTISKNRPRSVKPPSREPVPLIEPPAIRRVEPTLTMTFDLPASEVSLDFARPATADVMPVVSMETPDPPIPPARRASVADALESLGPVRITRDAPIQLGPYEVMERLDTRGDHDLHRARLRRASGFSKPVLLERVSLSAADPNAAGESLFAQSTRAASWSHPGILQVLDFDWTPEAHLVLEHVDGATLEYLLDRCRERGREVPITVACRIAQEVAAAVRFLHLQGVFHRDIGPHNVWIGFTGFAKLGGFLHVATSAKEAHAASFDVRARPSYAAPEMVAPHTAVLDAGAADVYGIGRILDECLTLTPLVSSRARTSTTDDLPSLAVRRPSVPANVADLVDRCLAREPNRRPPRIDGVEEELVKILRKRDPFTRGGFEDWASGFRAE